MTDPLLIMLDDNGVDVSTALELRFLHDEAAYRDCVLRFLNDNNMAILSSALVTQDYETAERAIHTLKSLADSLGFLSLFDEANDMFLSMRKGNYDSAYLLLPKVKTEYDKIIMLIKSSD